MFNSRRVVTATLTFVMFLVGACAAPQTSEELIDQIYVSFKKGTRERIAAGEGDYLAPLYESLDAEDYDTTIKRCEQFLELRPNDPTIYMLEGVAYDNKGEHYTAVKKLSSAIAIDETLWPAYYFRALSYRKLDEPRKILEDLDKVLDNKAAPLQIIQHYEKLGGYETVTEVDPGYETVA